MTTPLVKLLGQRELVTVISQPSGPYRIHVNGSRGGASLTPTALATTIHGASAKITPIDADEFALVDSEASNGLKKFTWSSFKTAMFAALGGLIIGGTAKTTIVDADHFAIGDSADSNATKKFSWASLKATLLSGGTIREVLTANRTYYVRTDGSDSNTGLANSAGGAFLTLQKAYDTICASLDLAGFTVTVEVEAGAYTAGVAIDKSWTGGGSVVFDGDTTTPANVLLDLTAAHAFRITVPLPGSLVIQGFKGQTTTSGSIIYMSAPGQLTLGNNEYGACANFHIRADAAGATVTVSGAYSITGGAIRHIDISQGASLFAGSGTVTLTGSLAFTTFAYVISAGSVAAGFVTYSGGTITGQRFYCSYGGAIAAGSLTRFPGNASGYWVGGNYDNLPVRNPPVTKTADFTVANSEDSIINNKSGSACVATLPSAVAQPGRRIRFKNHQAQQLNSNASNVVPLGGGAAGTAILSANAGRWADLESDGTNWQIMAGVV